MSTHATPELSRRRFLLQTSLGLAAVAAGSVNAEPAPVPASPSGKRIRLGVVGCGGRGQWIMKLFREHGGYEIVAVADAFRDKVDQAGGELQVPENRRFTGTQCAEKMIAAGGLDAVAIMSPPYFHPSQARAAVDAGLHVYLAKPIAVDVPGCLSIKQSGELARRKGLAFVVDFQTRTNPFYIEGMRRLHSGAVGDVIWGEAAYHGGRLSKQAEPGTPEARLRNWVFDQALSGDVIVEQFIHALDVMSWSLGEKPPLRCTGTGGRRVRLDVGDCWDHYELVYEYPNDVGITFTGRQHDASGDADAIANRIFTSGGAVLSTAYGGNVMMRADAKNFYRGGNTGGIYQEGAVANIGTFHRAIAEQDASNLTVEPSVTSNLVAIMGRMATRAKRTVTWEEVLASKQVLQADLAGLPS